MKNKSAKDIIGKARGLTIKQADFAFNVAIGKTQAEAYRLAYDAENMSDSAIYNAASQLMDHPLVADRVNAVLEERYRKSLIHNVKHVRQHVFDGLMRESMDKNNKASDRIKALVALGNVDVVGMFKENREATAIPSRKSAEIEAQIKDKLRKFLDSEVIDITPQSGESDTPKS